MSDTKWSLPSPVLEEDGFAYYSADTAPLSLYGVFREGDCYVRLPREVAIQTSDNVAALQNNCAGGRVRFRTDSPRIAFRYTSHAICRMNHFPLSGSAGLDLYTREDGEERWIYGFIPTENREYQSTVTVPYPGMHTYTLNLPTYAGIKEVLIGIEKEAHWEPAEPYKIEKPVVFYGSSITQGGCSSRPGNTYEACLSRALDFHFINLGFSGCCRAEIPMMEYIRSLDMSLFVYDYDHNSYQREELTERHARGYRMVREAHPDLPILLMNRPKFELDGEETLRREVIFDTYRQAREAGDRNIYFVDNRALMAFARYDGTVDGCHPNDLGFYSMAQALEPVIREILYH